MAETLLVQATRSGQVDKVINIIHSANANVNFTDANGRTALHFAAEKGQVDVVKALISHGADVDIQESPALDGSYPLHLAVRGGHVSTVTLLLHNDADPSTQDKYGFTPLHLAARFGHEKLVSMLLQHGT
eukprot:TRINITY_DN6583_c0_g3_i1.p1 TRINITY_DN6583_c0_g3~~TRINITY_DN6583_c0_g3_i1.p1  ORF type:complete len:130 (-),score=9.10 TRINITY_DN6583_c0_g3_i1:91-480(-)